MQWWQAAPGFRVSGQPLAVDDLVHDSREVRPGVAFIALPGRLHDGHDYLAGALDSGAAALVVQGDRESAWRSFEGRIPLVIVDDCRIAMGPLASTVHGDPSSHLRLVGVTGTDGKTTVAHLTAHVLDCCGISAGYLSSVGFDSDGSFEGNASHMTTLEATTIQRYLHRAVAAPKQAMVVEASSEGLAQHRLDGCQFDVAVFTNLTRDHLDFHGTMERYLEAKGLLFRMLSDSSAKTFPRAAVINGDDDAAAYLRRICTAPVTSYGEQEGNHYRIANIQTTDAGVAFDLKAPGGLVTVRSHLLGRFNAFNAAAAIAVAVSQGAPLKRAAAAIESFAGVPGRLERIDCGQAFEVYVDIASTPAALTSVLQALRPVTRGRLWVVFGAAGGRDPARRHSMGAVAARLADQAVLTNEDPRDEDPEAIIEAIAQGLGETGKQEGRDFRRQPDRREAIRLAFSEARPGDTVLLAGKATETTIIVGKQHLPWDERAVARQLLGGG